MRFRSVPDKISFVTLPLGHSAAKWVVLPSKYPDGLMVSSTSAIDPKPKAPVLPEPGLLYLRAWRASHSSRHCIELISR